MINKLFHDQKLKKKNDSKIKQKKLNTKINNAINIKKKNIYDLTSEYICSNKKKFLLIDITIICIIIFYIYRFIYHQDIFTDKFFKQMKTQYHRYMHNKLNFIVLNIFIVLILLFSSISIHEFQSLSIVLFITFITSIFQKGDAFVLSASIAGIFVYFLLRIKIFIYNKKHKNNCKKINEN